MLLIGVVQAFAVAAPEGQRAWFKFSKAFIVYSSNPYVRVVHEGLRGIAADGGTLGASLASGDRVTLLGFFSVNLKRALDAIRASANSKGLAQTVDDALEFFIFGKTTKAAWPKGTTRS